MASAHAARNAQAKRGAANEDHNTLLTALIHEGGIQQKKETWKGALDKARGPLYGLDKHMIGLIEARVQAERAAYESEDPESLLSSMFEEGSMTARLPPDEDLVLSQVLEKRNQDHHWHKRQVILTPTVMTVVNHVEQPVDFEAGPDSPKDEKKSPGRGAHQDVLFKGIMKKRGHHNTDFKPRFFVLDGSGSVSYYVNEKEYDGCFEPRGSFSCNGLTMVESCGRSKDGFLFKIFTKADGLEKIFECACVTVAERSQWVSCLHAASQVHAMPGSDNWSNKAFHQKLHALLEANKNAKTEKPHVIKDLIPLRMIHKVRILRGNPQEDMLDMVSSRRIDPLIIHESPISESAEDLQLATGKQDVSPVTPSQSFVPDEEESAEYFVMEIHTCVEGFWSVFFFRSRDKDLLFRYAQEINRYSRACLHVYCVLSKSSIQRAQEALRAWYASDPIQIVVAVLIVANFLANAAQTEILPSKEDKAYQLFQDMDLFFTYVFTVELAVNLAANWFWPFFTDGWACFDFIVVSVGILSLIFGDMPGVSTLRLMRAFRVMRLFGRLQSLRQIIEALTASMIPVGNALLIMLLITSIYAILAVNFYADRSPEFFGSFSKALFSLFQVCTGDGWASSIARPIFTGADNPDTEPLDVATAAFFLSFVVIVAWTLLQVVVAVLLDNFTAAADQEKQRVAAAKAKEEGRTPVTYAIDPLLSALANFDTSEDLSKRICLLFRVLDVDDSGGLTFKELQSGLKKFKVTPPISISRDDWDTMTQNGSIENACGEIVEGTFEIMMRHQLKLFVQRQMANSMEITGTDGSNHLGNIIFVLKLLMIGVDDINQQEFESDVHRDYASRQVEIMGGNLQEQVELEALAHFASRPGFPRAAGPAGKAVVPESTENHGHGSVVANGQTIGETKRVLKIEDAVSQIQQRLDNLEQVTEKFMGSVQGDVKQIIHALSNNGFSKASTLEDSKRVISLGHLQHNVQEEREVINANNSDYMEMGNSFIDVDGAAERTPMATPYQPVLNSDTLDGAGSMSGGVRRAFVPATPSTPPAASASNSHEAVRREHDSAQIPSGWVKLWSKTRNRPYYKNETTGKSSWVLPQEAESQDDSHRMQQAAVSRVAPDSFESTAHWDAAGLQDHSEAYRV